MLYLFPIMLYIRLFLIILPIILSVFPHYAQSKNEKIVMNSQVVTDVLVLVVL